MATNMTVTSGRNFVQPPIFPARWYAFCQQGGMRSGGERGAMTPAGGWTVTTGPEGLAWTGYKGSVTI
ncbi:MAG TPA: hypothetical protein GXX55_09735 [Firmicutes bacterium]|nr:hypothetical protein [Bacillota bacterium]